MGYKVKSVADYDAWYRTARGRWIAEQEFSVLLKLFSLTEGQTLLDVGCGTGHFSECFQQQGLHVTGLDPDFAMIEFARAKKSQVHYVEGDARALPFVDNSFDYCCAITSLCFIDEAEKALKEMLRVSRHGVILGLLNRYSILHYQKKQSKSYQGARWDSVSLVNQWCRTINPGLKVDIKSAVLIPSAGILAQLIEKFLPDTFPFASFIAVGVQNKKTDSICTQHYLY